MAPPPPSTEEEGGGYGGSSSDSDRDDALDEDMEALRRACMITGSSPGHLGGGAGAGSLGESSDSEDDLDLLRNIQERFSIPPPDASGLPIVKPLNSILPTDSESEDDFEILRAIQRRFEQYDNDSIRKKCEKSSDEAAVDSSIVHKTFSSISVGTPEDIGNVSVNLNQAEERTCHLSSRAPMLSRFPKYAQAFVDALKKNRSCQKFIRTKLIEIEAKIEQNKKMRERLKCLVDFQAASRKRMARVLNQNKDPRVRLISLPKLKISSTSKASMRTPLQCGPPENSHVSKYKMVLSRFPVFLCKQPWSQTEKENLAKGIKQQYQERALLSTMELSSDLAGTIGDSACILRDNFEFSPARITSFLPMVNWERLSSMYLPGRSGAECEARWLNTEDPMINHNPWTILEEKKLLHIVQNKGIYNWIDIAILLGTHRTPFHCLVHYQRSLNPCILKKDWTKDEDARLRAAVETLGDDNWQIVASNMEGRTGPQCSNRWRKSLHPIGRRVGRWSVDEDKRLKITVTLFGAKNWNKIAQFIPGRTQVQCRERWVNCLDPSLNLKEWTEEEDAKLKEAITTFGYCWSKVASFVSLRTDNQCWRRWKVLFPDEVPLRQANWKMQKAVLISNFVDRESERPSIGPNDFCYVPEISSNGVLHVNNDGTGTKKLRRQRKSKNQIGLSPSNVSKPVHSRECKAKVEKSKKIVTKGNRPDHSRNSKPKVKNSKENATTDNLLEVIRHKTISNKWKKGPRKQHIELDQPICSEDNHEFVQHMELMQRPDDVFQLDATTRTCLDVASQSVHKAVSKKRKKRSDKQDIELDQHICSEGNQEFAQHVECTTCLDVASRRKTISKKRKKRSDEQDIELDQHIGSEGDQELSRYVACIQWSDGVSQLDATARSSEVPSRNKTISMKRKKGSGRQHIEDQHICSEDNWALAQFAECICRSDGVSQLDAAARSSDVASSSFGLQRCFSRKPKTKVKSHQKNLIRDGLEEPYVDKTILRKRKRSVNMASDANSTQSGREHEYSESSILCVDACEGTFESELGDDTPLAAFLDARSKAFRKYTLMPTPEENSTQVGLAKLSEHIRKRNDRRSCRLLPEGDGYTQSNDKLVVPRLTDGSQDETPRMAPQAKVAQTVRITEGDGPPDSILHCESENEFGLRGVDQAISVNSDTSVVPNDSEKGIPTATSKA